MQDGNNKSNTSESLEQFLTDYFEIWLGVDQIPQGLIHNVRWQEFVDTKLPSSILLVYDEPTRRFIIGEEGFSSNDHAREGILFLLCKGKQLFLFFPIFADFQIYLGFEVFGG